MWTLSTVCGDHAGDRPPHLETPDADLDRRRHDILHDTRAVHILRQIPVVGACLAAFYGLR